MSTKPCPENPPGRDNFTPIDAVLTRLNGVHQRAPGRWLARCPGPLHRRGDRNRSLSVGETSDGTVLIRCFAGCGPTEILGAVGLELRDLFPPRESGYSTKPKAPPIPWRDIFTALERDIRVCALAFGDLARGKQFRPKDAEEIARFANDLADKLTEASSAR
jgi:hypothetical protein